ncbi:RNA ligase family protein [Streptomyces sp. NBC_00539]|uniref:RNA ligase family protein n=1 Tax=Streptomyces sp. NBC_00539 TaxID=2975770 RepID=UPI002E81AC23|nr:RNA ligase family protein [Streptomyces sp. NBC_00539]WUC67736.1 AAA family ATPase [Streptomyces sp. NBC_00539]
MRTHYPRTAHLPWSPGATPDDVRMSGPIALAGREVVVTEKLDGENTTLYRDGLHARSPDSGHHPSRAWVKGLQGRIGPQIPAGRRVCGENLYARHSLPYEDLDGWFYGFSVWDGDHCLDWDRTVRFLRRLGVPTPRVLWRGVYDERALRKLRIDTARQEGYVVRTVAGFPRTDFGRYVAKWVRAGHVRTDTHWMYAPVVPNGLGPAAPLWAVRSGSEPDPAALLGALGMEPGPAPGAAEAVADVAARLDGLGRTGESRLTGVLAAALHGVPRARLGARLAAGPLGMPSARRVADLVGLYPALRRPFPDAERRAGLVRLASAADLGVLHALAGALGDPRDGAGRECVEWSALYAQEEGLLGPDPLGPLRSGLREALAGLGQRAADRCWAQAREAFGRARVHTAEEAVAATWRLRDGAFPYLVQLCGPSGSGKSTYAGRLAGVETYISLDDLRTARGSRSDQRANADVLREGLDRLDTALAAAARTGQTVVWDATSLTKQQRGLAGAVARRRDALVTHAVLWVEEDELVRRNASRAHPVPDAVLDSQLRRFGPPYPGEAHLTWYVGGDGTLADTAGSIDEADAEETPAVVGTPGGDC